VVEGGGRRRGRIMKIKRESELLRVLFFKSNKQASKKKR
jgi:hypothetical protein